MPQYGREAADLRDWHWPSPFETRITREKQKAFCQNALIIPSIPSWSGAAAFASSNQSAA